LPKVGKKHDLTACGVRQILLRNNVKLRTPSESQLLNKKYNEQKVLSLYAQGFSTLIIGKKFGVSGSAISTILKRNNIKARTNSEAQIVRYKRLKEETK